MRSLLFLFISLSIFPLAAQEVNLPHYLSDRERDLYKTYQAAPSQSGIAEQPPVPVRTMAEWEELQGIMITWTSYPNILSQIIDHAQEEGLVYIVCSDSNQVKNYLLMRNIPLYNLIFLVEPYNSIWCRDYGPWTAYADGYDSLYFIDWIYNRPRPDDDVIPAAMAAYLQVPLYETTQHPDDLVHTGGNFMVDGHGRAFSSKLILDENNSKSEAEIDDILFRYMGIQSYVKMDNLPHDAIHHIDMHMKLLDEETLLVGEYPPGVADGPQIEANLDYVINNYKTCFGRDYEVVRIPMPPDQYGRYPDTGGLYRTYTNSVIINKTVIVPIYEEQYDTTAIRIYREAMPGYNIIGVNCNDIISSGGAIHCITKEIGSRDPLFISHARIRQAYAQQEDYEVWARIRTHTGVEQAVLFWSVDTSQGFIEVPMIPTSNDSFLAAIPGQAAGSKVYYYLSASSHSGKVISKPSPAPQGTYRFMVEGTSLVSDPALPANQGYILYPAYPNPFNQTTTITYRLDALAHVELSIYNLTGQKIVDLLSAQQAPGIYRIPWNAENCASGIYFVRLMVAGQTQYRKLVLIR